MAPYIDIAFDCLPLRSIGRIDVPLDASPAFRARCERLQLAIDEHSGENAYFLYNTRCVYRFANSDVESMLRFTFDGTLLTDHSDRRAERADFDIRLEAATCVDPPPAVLAWFHGTVERAVLIEFDRFIAAGSLAKRVHEVGPRASVAEISDFVGMDV